MNQSGIEGGGMTEGVPLPTVDVVVATRNRPELLRLALDAIWNQSYGGEIVCHVVFDQCDPDETVARSGPLRTIQTMTNNRTPGLAGARNSGILAGSGALVAFCDDDDEWLPTKIEKQVEALAGSAAVTSVTGIIVLYADSSVERVPRAEDMTLEAACARPRHGGAPLDSDGAA